MHVCPRQKTHWMTQDNFNHLLITLSTRVTQLQNAIIEDSVGIVQTKLFMHEQIVYLDTRFTASSLTHHHHPLGQAYLRKNCSNKKTTCMCIKGEIHLNAVASINCFIIYKSTPSKKNNACTFTVTLRTCRVQSTGRGGEGEASPPNTQASPTNVFQLQYK